MSQKDKVTPQKTSSEPNVPACLHIWKCLFKDIAYIVCSSISVIALCLPLTRGCPQTTRYIALVSHSLYPSFVLSSFLSMALQSAAAQRRKNIPNPPDDETTETCVFGLKTCNKMRVGANIVPGGWRGLTWLSFLSDMCSVVSWG